NTTAIRSGPTSSSSLYSMLTTPSTAPVSSPLDVASSCSCGTWNARYRYQEPSTRTSGLALILLLLFVLVCRCRRLRWRLRHFDALYRARLFRQHERAALTARHGAARDQSGEHQVPRQAPKRVHFLRASSAAIRL